jgi:hypothetical protein
MHFYARANENAGLVKGVDLFVTQQAAAICVPAV